ncbi:MAG TPA: polysaccharide biosynthesis/export family protein [Bacteroidia bacterium]|nr:polysaccharide biosynthesis/export family protein [Bacteroidia bacterium]
MMKTPKGYVYDKIADSMAVDDYKISPNDAITFRLLSNEGFKLVDISTMNNITGTSNFDAIVETDGTVKLPLIGRIKLEGLTTRESEQLLETRFSEFYVGPYIVVRVSNKRIAIFPGGGGAARVIQIPNNNTTVFEALALAGGVAEDGKAYKIKLIRKASPKPKVYLMDLSTIDGLKEGNTVVQANDIIYIEARNRNANRLTQEFVPYISLLSTFLLLYSILKK